MRGEGLMKGFPPPPELRVTLANWRKPPFNKWSFKHVREIVPTAEIANDPARIRELRVAPYDFADWKLQDEDHLHSLDSFLRATDTDAFMILHEGNIVYEFYDSRMSWHTAHILMSISKSVLGMIVGILVDSNTLQLSDLVTGWIPEVRNTAYSGAKLRDLLDMRAGIHFVEDYLATAGPIVEYRKAQNWDPLSPGECPSDLRTFFSSLTQKEGRHGGPMHYVSPNTDLMGWVIERASGTRYADLIAEVLWGPMGAGRTAYITVDRLGAPRCAGGFCATIGDLARFGQLVAGGGSHAGKQIIPESWVGDILANGDAKAWSEGDFAKYFPEIPMHYRSKWYVVRGSAPMMFALGIFGQNLFIDANNQLVIVRFASQAQPMDEKKIILMMRGVEEIRRVLSVR
jgi:CubicO group peptidase (beta-lactamase class C family)